MTNQEAEDEVTKKYRLLRLPILLSYKINSPSFLNFNKVSIESWWWSSPNYNHVKFNPNHDLFINLAKSYLCHNKTLTTA